MKCIIRPALKHASLGGGRRGGIPLIDFIFYVEVELTLPAKWWSSSNWKSEKSSEPFKRGKVLHISKP